jgi:hypothetical protein
MSKNTNISHWIDLVKHGDSVAANRIWHHYFNRLVRAVRQRLYGQNRAVSDEEDVVLSVFNSFYSAVEKAVSPTCQIETTCGSCCCECRPEKWSTSEDTTAGSDAEDRSSSTPWTTPATTKPSSKPSETNRPPKWC